MIDWSQAAVGLLAVVLSAALGWPLTSGVLHMAARSADADADPDEDARHGDDDGGEGDHEDDDRSPPPGGPTGARARDALRGGTWIGILERTAITGCLLTGYPGGIAFVIAVKGLGRYPELRDNPGASERFVIGTLASMLWAAAVGVAAEALLSSWS